MQRKARLVRQESFTNFFSNGRSKHEVLRLKTACNNTADLPLQLNRILSTTTGLGSLNMQVS